MRTAIRFILLFCISTAYAQTPVRQQPRFALEIAEDGVPSRFVIVPEGPGGSVDSGFYGPSFHLLPGREAGNSEQSQPSAVRIVAKVDGDEVAFTVSVIFGPFVPKDTNYSLEGHSQRSVGSYSAHLNESITLQGMEQFGLRPWTIKIVNAQLSGPASLPMVNEVPSIRPEILGKDREGYRIALHNLSTVVDVKDDSSVNCPVRMSGTITFTESEAGGFHHAALSSYALAATNLSNVPIVALVTYTLIGTSRGPLLADDRQLDAFFSHDLEIAPGKTWTKTRKDAGSFNTEVKDGASKVAPSASSKVIFVQFADSSTCGDVTDGRVVDLMEARVDLLQALKKWDDAAKLGDSQFLKALAEEPTDRTGNASGILNDIREKQKEIGSAAVIDHIRSMLDVAASR